MNKELAIEFLNEIVEDIIHTRGTCNVASTRPHLRKYSVFREIDSALSVDEQDNVIRERLSFQLD